MFFICWAGKQRHAAIPQTRLFSGHFRPGIWQQSLFLGPFQPGLVKPRDPGWSRPCRGAAGTRPPPCCPSGLGEVGPGGETEARANPVSVPVSVLPWGREGKDKRMLCEALGTPCWDQLPQPGGAQPGRCLSPCSCPSSWLCTPAAWPRWVPSTWGQKGTCRGWHRGEQPLLHTARVGNSSAARQASRHGHRGIGHPGTGHCGTGHRGIGLRGTGWPSLQGSFCMSALSKQVGLCEAA